MYKIEDLTGNVYGRLTVISKETQSDSCNRWICQCSCGNKKLILGSSLRNRKAKSCGCNRKHKPRHGETLQGFHTKEYCAWARTKAKCTNKNHSHYKWYGARGIKMCDAWLNSYESFLSDMGRAPSKKHSLGRIDNDGNYEPSNCRWETIEQQANNRRDNRFVEYNGELKTISQWSRKLSIKYSVLEYHLSIGKSLHEIVSNKYKSS